MWSGEGEVSWAGDVKKETSSESGSDSESGWSELEWSDIEDGERVTVGESKVNADEEEDGEDIYTQTNRLFMQSNTTETGIKKEDAAEDAEDAEDPPPQSPPAQSSPSYALDPARRPRESTPRRAQNQADDEIMRHLIGGMADLAIPMSQDDGGRWRIQKRR